MSLVFPNIDPVAFTIGPLMVRWYSLAYLAGFLGGWQMARLLVQRSRLALPTLKQVDDFVFWIVLGVILGGRIGYVLFYNLSYFMQHPDHIFKTWEGGMSFHGGLLGVVIAVVVFAWKNKIPILRLGDLSACGATVGLFFGRLANFANGELYGRVTDAPIGMVFPRGGPLPRHPSQLYEAFAEGLVLFIFLNGIAYFKPHLQKKHGLFFGFFLFWYGIARFCIEFFREPDVQIGLHAGIFSQGQLLCMPMILAGAFLIHYANRRHA